MAIPRQCLAGVFLVGLLLFGASDVQGAIVTGKIYDYSFVVLDDVFVMVDSSPDQKMIAKDGYYEFTLRPGNYTIEARHYENNDLAYFTVEDISITDDGIYVIDLILFPSLEGTEKLLDLEPDVDDIYNEPILMVKWLNIFIGAIFVLALLIGVYLIHRFWAGKKTAGSVYHTAVPVHRSDEMPDVDAAKHAKLQQDVNAEPEKDVRNDEVKVLQDAKAANDADIPSEAKVTSSATDLAAMQARQELDPPGQSQIKASKPKEDDVRKRVLQIISENQRITQKEIRKLVPYSEAKISLVISELESENLIQKIRKGRGNIIRLM